jgi:L-ascorbate metabolism protein UlaG (beta-lactamase superfamily)
MTLVRSATIILNLGGVRLLVDPMLDDVPRASYARRPRDNGRVSGCGVSTGAPASALRLKPRRWPPIPFRQPVSRQLFAGVRRRSRRRRTSCSTVTLA